MLGGRHGDGVALAMRVISGLARIEGAPRLVEITSAHVDSCLYHGQVSLDFAHKLVGLGAKVRVPTTLNVGSMDLLHPGLVRTDTDAERETALRGRELMSAYVDLGPRLRLTWSVYWDTDRPHHLVQDLYPDAPGGPMLYTPADQALYGQRTAGGWYRAPATFVDALESAGVPSPAELRRARTELSSYLLPIASGLTARW